MEFGKDRHAKARNGNRRWTTGKSSFRRSHSVGREDLSEAGPCEPEPRHDPKSGSAGQKPRRRQAVSQQRNDDYVPEFILRRVLPKGNGGPGTSARLAPMVPAQGDRVAQSGANLALVVGRLSLGLSLCPQRTPMSLSDGERPKVVAVRASSLILEKVHTVG